MGGWLRSQGPSSSCLGFTPSSFLVTCCLLFLQIFWSPFLQPKIRCWVFYTHSGPGVWELGMVNAKCMGNSGAYEKGPSVQTDLTQFKNEVKMVTPEVVRSLP